MIKRVVLMMIIFTLALSAYAFAAESGSGVIERTEYQHLTGTAIAQGDILVAQLVELIEETKAETSK